MSQDKRHAGATTGAGAGLMFAGGAAQHRALDAAYGKNPNTGKPYKRPHEVTGKFKDRFLEQRIFLHKPKGRAQYVGGAAAVLAGSSALATGVNGLAKRDAKRKKRKSLLSEGYSGVRESMSSRLETAKNPAPAHLVAGSYGVGVGIGSGVGALTHIGLGRAKVPGAIRSGTALVAGGTVGAATLPLQSKAIRRASHDKYEATPTGVRRRLVPTGKDGEVVKLESSYRGKDMSRGHKRAMVMGSSGIPIIPFAGDIAAASTAASLAPPELRKKTAALQFGGAQAGGLAAGAAGAYGLSAAAKRPGVERVIDAGGAKMGRGKARLRSRLGLAPKDVKVKTNPLTRVAEHPKTPKKVSRAMKPLLRNPKIAVLGGVVGSTLGGQAGGYTGYGHALKLEEQRNARIGKARDSRHGVSKLQDKPMTDKQRHAKASKKRLQANISTFTGITGMGALAATAAGKIPKYKKLASLQTPLLTAGAGVGGAGSFNFARYTREEANREDRPLHKALRIPGMRRGGLVRTRGIGGPRVSTRRGGFAKSLVNGKYVRAVDAGAGALRGAKGGHLRPTPLPASRHPENAGLAGLKNLPTRASTTHGKVRFNAGMSAERQSQIESGLPKKIRRPVTFHGEEVPNVLPPGRDGETYARGGPRKPSHIFLAPHANADHVNHELAHAAPRRNYKRVAEINADPVRSRREEARADGVMARHNPGKKRVMTDYEGTAILHQAEKNGNKSAGAVHFLAGANHDADAAYIGVRNKMKSPIRGVDAFPDTGHFPAVKAGHPGAPRPGRTGLKRRLFGKALLTMSDEDAGKLSRKYDTKGPLPKTLNRADRMKAYEARYISSGGRKGEKWTKRADRAEVARNVGLAGATASAAGILASRTRLRGGLKKVPGVRRVTQNHLEVAGLASAAAGGGAELAGEHARHRRASYRNSPAGVAGSALSRMQSYTPGVKQ